MTLNEINSKIWWTDYAKCRGFDTVEKLDKAIAELEKKTELTPDEEDQLVEMQNMRERL